MKRLQLLDAPANQTGLVKEWTEAVVIPTYHPLPADKNLWLATCYVRARFHR